MGIACFLIEPVGRVNLFLRRYRSSAAAEDAKRCPLNHGYHDVWTAIGQAAEKKTGEGYTESIDPSIYQDDPRWPTRCACGYEFCITDEADKFQVFQDAVYRRTDTGEERGHRDWEKVPGAMWNAFWWPSRQADGKSPVVVLPGGQEWMIDGRASNCDSPCKNCGQPYHAHTGKACVRYEDARPHQCWVREGVMPALTVGKGGITCGAGAGSILVPGWHGFLRNGVLEPC